VDCYELPEEEPPVLPAPQTSCELYGGLTANVTLNGPVTSQSLGIAGYTNKVIHINGEFTVNTHFSFTDCKVKMGPGAKIKVINSKNFTTLSSYLFACTKMWAGIEVGTNSSCDMYFSTVEDAQYALYVLLDSRIELEGNIFNRNWVGFRADDNFKMASFRLNIYKHSGPVLNMPFTNQSPAPAGTKGFAGMWFDGLSSTLTLKPTTIGQVNLFSGLNIGILSKSTKLVVNKSCRFTGIVWAGTDGILNGFQTGVGILSQVGNFVNYTGFNATPGAASSFEGCHTGVKIESGASCNMSYASFQKNARGIWVKQSDIFFTCFVDRLAWHFGGIRRQRTIFFCGQ
jgi:hypothetical protein